MAITINGGCHCGKVRFQAEVPEAVEVLDCNCSICTMTGFRHLIVPHRDFRLLSGNEHLSSYRSARARRSIFSAALAGSRASISRVRTPTRGA
jgi:hypothetical protein